MPTRKFSILVFGKKECVKKQSQQKNIFELFCVPCRASERPPPTAIDTIHEGLIVVWAGLEFIGTS